jgi:hypothetical protein
VTSIATLMGYCAVDAINLLSAENLEGRTDVGRAVGSTASLMFIYDLAPGESRTGRTRS